jgi:tRNA(Leu) C34 or U34 (ribose-2'-O)-methylase TrmL
MDMQFTSTSIINSSHQHSLPTEIVHAYGKWIQDHIDLGWDGYLITFMFRNISGSADAKVQQMHREIAKFYEKLATRVVRKPRSDKWVHLLPKGVFFPDVPAYKKSEYSVAEVSINDGIRFHGIMVVPKDTRLKEPLHLHLLRKRKLYVKDKIYRIHAERITEKAAFVTDYGGKAIKKRRFENDHVLLFPRSVGELPAEICEQSGDEETRAIKDIQSSKNVSAEVAKSIYQTSTPRKRR